MPQCSPGQHQEHGRLLALPQPLLTPVVVPHTAQELQQKQGAETSPKQPGRAAIPHPDQLLSFLQPGHVHLIGAPARAHSFTWLSMRSSTSDVLLWSASTTAKIPDPEMKFDSTFRLFSVLLTFSISASACGQRRVGRAGSRKAGQSSRGPTPLASGGHWEDPVCQQVSLTPDGRALQGVPPIAGDS